MDWVGLGWIEWDGIGWDWIGWDFWIFGVFLRKFLDPTSLSSLCRSSRGRYDELPCVTMGWDIG